MSDLNYKAGFSPFQQKMQALLAQEQLESDDPAFLSGLLDLAIKLFGQADKELETARSEANRAFQ